MLLVILTIIPIPNISSSEATRESSEEKRIESLKLIDQKQLLTETKQNDSETE